LGGGLGKGLYLLEKAALRGEEVTNEAGVRKVRTLELVVGHKTSSLYRHMTK